MWTDIELSRSSQRNRRGRWQSFDDLVHYRKKIIALKGIMRLIKVIDRVIPSLPIE